MNFSDHVMLVILLIIIDHFLKLLPFEISIDHYIDN